MDVFNHADDGFVAMGIGADVASLCVGNVVTNAAMLHVIAQTDEALAESVDGFAFLVEQVECEAECCFPSHSWQTGEFLNGLFEEFRGVLFVSHQLAEVGRYK